MTKEDRLSLTEEFEFNAKGGFKRFCKDFCAVMDEEGTMAQARFDAVKELGARIQQGLSESEKALKTIYRTEINHILEKYGFVKGHEPLLRKMLNSYWKHADELTLALDGAPPVSVPKASQALSRAEPEPAHPALV